MDTTTALLALKLNGTFLQFIPEALRTPDLCETAVRQTKKALEFVPSKYKPLNFDRIFSYRRLRLREIPLKSRSYRMCCWAISRDGLDLEFVPDHLKTSFLCELAISKNGAALEFVPKKLLTKRLCIKAAKKDRRALRYLPKEYYNVTIRSILKEQSGVGFKDLLNVNLFFSKHPGISKIIFDPDFYRLQSAELISLILVNSTPAILDQIGDNLNLNLIKPQDRVHLMLCQNKKIRAYLNRFGPKALPDS